MPRHIRACTVEKEMEASLTEVLEKDTGSNLMSKHLHMANENTIQPQQVFGMRAVTSSSETFSFYHSHSSGFHPIALLK